MNVRFTAPALLLLFVLPLAGCNSLRTIEVTPAAGTQVLTAVGQTAQYHAMATYQMGTASATYEDVTSSAQWSAASVAVGTINSKGLATAAGAGNTVISATLGGATASSDLTVNLSTASSTPATLTVVPSASLAASTTVGGTTQFIAIGNLAGSSNVQDLTKSVKWLSSAASVATVSTSGLAIGVGPGSTVITAELNGLVSSSTLVVASTPAPTVAPATLTVIPVVGIAQITIAGETTQFLAIGNVEGSSTITDLTDAVQWVSSDVSVATINATGLATGVAANGSQSISAITALLTSPDKSVITATSSITVVASGQPVNLPTLSVYETGNGTGTVTTADGTINCGTGTACTGHFSTGTVVTLTAVPAAGSSFGGWSSSCAPAAPNGATPPYTAPYSCTVTMSNNESVGVVFNTP